MQTIRTESHIEAVGGYGYSVIINSDNAEQITDNYLEALLNWAKNDWDWEAVVTPNRQEEYRRIARQELQEEGEVVRTGMPRDIADAHARDALEELKR